MSQELIVKRNLSINAPASKVWEVLVKPQFIRQWDELPDDFGEQPLSLGREITWEREDGGFVKLTVTRFEPEKQLKLSLYNSSWDQAPSAYDIAYTYLLSSQDGSTGLEVEIGDFKALPNGQDYYEASEEFGDTSIQKIKALAEG
jgi:uncharacterized protein YndB with AHSA1/START domain